MKKYLYFVFAIIFLVTLAMPFVSSAHYVVGIVNNALDGAASNGRSIVLWNPAYGINDNLTDIIGLNGNSGIDNVYMIDCEMLDTSCKIGDTLKAMVLNDGDGRITYEANVFITGAGYDVFPELTLNSFPNPSLISPVNHANISALDIVFNCSVSDPDSNLKNITLYGNWSGGWHINETKTLSGSYSSETFTKQISEGRYIWNCLSYDNLSLSNYSNSNFSFTVDRTPPVISNIEINQSYSCGNFSYIRVNCTANDNLLEINNLIIQAIKPNGTVNYSTQKISNTYYSDIPLNIEGTWRFNCIANDSVGNIANLTSPNYYVYSSNPDLNIFLDRISFSDLSPVENQEITINANISNLGCGDATNLLVGFYKGDPDSGGFLIGNTTISILGLNNGSANISWILDIGSSNIFIFADSNYSINELNETDNKANKTIILGVWQQFFGNVGLSRVVSDSSSFNMSIWNNKSINSGNIFLSNKGSHINWNNLQALGRKKNGDNSINDFSTADSLLGMSDFSDSLSNFYTYGGEVKDKDNFTFFNNTLFYVPIINSTNNSNFITGVLWDTTSDLNGYYDSSEKEPLVFITKINLNKPGSYGTYDYEIRIPALLRSYNSTENNVYLYYELT